MRLLLAWQFRSRWIRNGSERADGVFLEWWCQRRAWKDLHGMFREAYLEWKGETGGGESEQVVEWQKSRSSLRRPKFALYDPL